MCGFKYLVKKDVGNYKYLSKYLTFFQLTLAKKIAAMKRNNFYLDILSNSTTPFSCEHLVKVKLRNHLTTDKTSTIGSNFKDHLYVKHAAGPPTGGGGTGAFCPGPQPERPPEYLFKRSIYSNRAVRSKYSNRAVTVFFRGAV